MTLHQQQDECLLASERVPAPPLYYSEAADRYQLDSLFPSSMDPSRRPATSERNSSWLQDDQASIKTTGSTSSTESTLCSVVKPSPAKKSAIPFLPASTAIASDCSISIDESSCSEYVIKCHFPQFALEHITVALKRSGNLHIIANRWCEESESSTDKERETTHFERMVELGKDAIGRRAQATWEDGDRLTVKVPRRPSAQGRS